MDKPLDDTLVAEEEALSGFHAQLPSQRPAQWRIYWRRLKRRPAALVGTIIFCCFVFLAIFGPWLAPYNYAAQNSIFTWTAQLPGSWGHQVTGYTQVNVVQRTGHTAYPLWNAGLARNSGNLRPYLRLLNLSNTGYQEIVGVPMQGRTVMGGMEFNWSRH